MNPLFGPVMKRGKVSTPFTSGSGLGSRRVPGCEPESFGKGLRSGKDSVRTGDPVWTRHHVSQPSVRRGKMDDRESTSQTCANYSSSASTPWFSTFWTSVGRPVSDTPLSQRGRTKDDSGKCQPEERKGFGTRHETRVRPGGPVETEWTEVKGRG